MAYFWDEHMKTGREGLISVLQCDSIKEFYSMNGTAKDYDEFLRILNKGDVLEGVIYVRISGDMYAHGQFNIALSQNPGNFDKVKEYNLKVEKVKLITSRDDNCFYTLDGKGLHKSPVPEHIKTYNFKNNNRIKEQEIRCQMNLLQ